MQICLISASLLCLKLQGKELVTVSYIGKPYRRYLRHQKVADVSKIDFVGGVIVSAMIQGLREKKVSMPELRVNDLSETQRSSS